MFFQNFWMIHTSGSFLPLIWCIILIIKANIRSEDFSRKERILQKRKGKWCNRDNILFPQIIAGQYEKSREPRKRKEKEEK